MHNIKITIEYDGTNYRGWQYQKNSRRTLQEVIEKTLRLILQEKVKLIASGRTDAGVHAKAQVANFKTDTRIPLKKLKQALNSLLPDDIVITKASEVNLQFHARFDAKSKIYRYTILNKKHPSALWRNFAYFVPYGLDFKLMQKAARLLLGRHNFGCFQARDKKPRSSVRIIKRIRLSREGDFIFIDIQANSFLYKMVRNIAGTLIEIGRKKLSPISIQKLLTSGNRQLAGPTAPGHGLCLLQVKYRN
jgi:tRNA pseudouridine38-40 synthase